MKKRSSEYNNFPFAEGKLKKLSYCGNLNEKCSKKKRKSNSNWGFSLCNADIYAHRQCLHPSCAKLD
jgi:hypothetical protein